MLRTIKLIGTSSTSVGDDDITPLSSTSFECDIGKLLTEGTNLSTLSRDHKYSVLKTEPNPDATTYPRTRSSDSDCFRQFQPRRLQQYPWLHYSPSLDGAFCRACVFFAPSQAGGQDLGQFVSKPFSTWVKISTKAKTHAGKEYHLRAMTTMKEFIDRFENPTQAIDVMMQSRLQQLMERNQHVIESLLKIVLFCGKQGLAFRGHRDDRIDWSQESPSNEGNFVQLVRFRAETDPVLASHLKESPKNACYTSKGIQNELIDVVGRSIQLDIISEVKEAHFYSIIADEVTDVANKEELSLVLRYIFNNEIKEVFVDFIQVGRITGEVLGSTIVDWLSKHNLSLAYMRGQCYDGASNMSGARSGCQAFIQQSAPLAQYFHCASHRLNLAVVSACKIPALKNAESYIGEIARFFGFSPKRQRLLEKAIDKQEPAPRAMKLKDACRTRWVERIEAYATFLELLLPLHASLQAMVHPSLHSDLGVDWSWDGETVSRANGFLFSFNPLVSWYPSVFLSKCIRS